MPQRDASRGCRSFRPDCCLAVVLLILAAYQGPFSPAWSQESEDVARVVRQAFAEVHEGWSCDEVLLNDSLNARFVAACRKQFPQLSPAELNWTLLSLRKAGKLEVATRRRRVVDHGAYLAAAEIAARLVENTHHTNTDRMMCDPDLRAAFDSVAGTLAPGVESYFLRKAAFGLRKRRRLSPELVLRVADWERQIVVYGLPSLHANLQLAPTNPGVYLFRDRSGYLYIGESGDLRARLTQHLDESRESSLCNLLRAQAVDVEQVEVELHIFSRESAARETRMRRAYESELIASRKPRFNVRP